MIATTIAAQHLSNIQRQINVLDSYAASKPLNEAQKYTLQQRRKIYIDILADAKAVFEAIVLLQKENKMLSENLQLAKKIQLLKDSSPANFLGGFAAWRAQYHAGKLRPIMDMNKYHCI